MNARGVAAALPGLILAAQFLCATETDAVEVRSLSLDQAVRSALSQHPILRQAEIDINVAELRVRQARSQRLPQIDAGGLAKVGLAGSANLFALNGLAASPDPEGMAYSANIFQDLLDFKRSKFESEARRAEVEHFEETLQAEKSRLVLEVRTAFYSALKATRQIGVAEQAAREGALAVREATSLHRAGLASKLEVDEAQTALARARLEQTAARESLHRALARLNEAMGENTAQAYAFQEPEISAAEPEPVESLVAESLESRPELAAVEARIRAAEAWVERAEREKYPRIMTMFSGGWTRFAELTLGKLLFGGFGIQLPLFTGGRLEATIEQTRLAVEKTRAARDDLLRAVPRQVAEARAEVATSFEAVRVTAQALQQARDAERLASAQYRHELADLLDLTVAQTALNAAESERAQARYDYKIAEAELDFATGRAVRN